MADESTSYSDLISRRRFVELTGVTGAAALAGCDGDGDSDGDTPTDEPDDGTLTPDDTTPEEATDWYPDAEHISIETVNPGDLQFNPFNSSGAPGISDRLLFEKFAQYYYTDSTFHPAGLESWDLSGGTMTMNLREGMSWSNGETVTADDIVLQLRLGEYDEAPYWNYINSVEAVDDTTVELDVQENTNSVIIEASLFAGSGNMIKVDQETYGSYLDELEGSDSDAALEDLRGFADEEPVTNGPFAFVSSSDQALEAEHVRKVEGAENPWAANINFGNYTFEAGGNNQQRLNALRSLEVDSDFSLAVPARTMATFPDAIEEAQYWDVWGFGLYPNHEHQHAGDRAVRQAIAYAVNRQQAVTNSLPRAKKAPEFALGISDAEGNQRNWLGDEADNYETYGVDEVMADKVDEVMTGAGYSKVDGTWTDQDGNTVSLPVTCPSGWGDWVAMAQTAIQNLNEVGFESSFDGIADFLAPNNPLKEGDFVIGTGPWLHGGPLTHPYFSLQHNLSELQINGQEVRGAYPAWSEQWGGSNASIEVPSRTGSGTQEYDVNALVNEISQTNDDAVIQENVLDLAWVSNKDLPTIPMVDKILQQWLTSDDWTVPEGADTPHASVQFAPTWLPRQGLMNYRGD